MLSSLMPRVDADATTGQLDLSQRWRLVLALLGLQASRLAPGRGKPRGVLGEFENPLLWQAIEQPRGGLADAAWSLASADQPAWLLNHGLRTHAWAQALGVVGGLRPDGECLFAAAMLHDAGLTPVAATPQDHCFAVRGARYARLALVRAGPPEAIRIVEQAIARHLDLHVDMRDGIEAHLLHAGAMVDVLGRGLVRVPPAVREHVLATHPRRWMKDNLCRCMQREAAAAPDTRIGLYARRIGFIELIRRAPFAE